MLSMINQRVRTLFCGIILCALGLGPVAPGQAAAAPEDGEKFKDWSARCQKVKDSDREICHIYQQLVQKKDEKLVPVMKVIAGFLTADGKPALFVTVPLGVSLPQGLKVRVDDGETVSFQYSHCLTSGCIGAVVLTEDLVAEMKSGKQAIFTIYSGTQQDVSIAVSLLGFTAGFSTLEK